MIIEMKKGADKKIIQEAVKKIKAEGFDVLLRNRQGKVMIAVLGFGVGCVDFGNLEGVSNVAKTKTILDYDYAAFLEEQVFFVENYR